VEWVVTTGRTVEEAVETALDRLGVDEQDAEVEVLQEPQKGLFGRLRAEARVRARVRPSAPPPKVDRRDRRRRDRRSGAGREGAAERSDRSRSRSAAGGGSGGGRPRSGRAENGRDGGRVPAGTAASAAATGSAAGVADTDVDAGTGSGAVEGGRGSGSGSATGGQGGGRRRRRGSGREGGRDEGAGVSETTTTAEAAGTTIDIEAQRAAVEEFLRGLLDAFGRSDATVTATVADASVDGESLGVLVGQKGVTLQSLQELVRSMVQRRFVGQTHARVRVDVAGYRERRRIALERFTVDVAASVRESGVAKALDPMGAADRKVIHDAVNAIEGVETVSEGEDADRHVVIRPSA
jgi:spoIIIJ-associated protein